MSLAVNVLSRNPNEDRVIPRFARYLRDGLGWTLTARPVGVGFDRSSSTNSTQPTRADVYYLSGYFEWPLLNAKAQGRKVAYFTHLEEDNSAKQRLFFEVAGRVDLRIVTARMYGEMLAEYGPTVQILPPVERERFTIPPSMGKVGSRPVVAGFSGYTYRGGRKGEGLAGELVRRVSGARALQERALQTERVSIRRAKTNPPTQPAWGGIEWRASGRGWPVATRRYSWAEMPSFYQSLDILVCTATVEGVPMPVLEALSCGVSVVVPRGVGLLDELGRQGVGRQGVGRQDDGAPNGAPVGIHRYERGKGEDLARAFGEAVEMRRRVDRESLRAVTEGFTVEGWCRGHEEAFEELFLTRSHGEHRVVYPVRDESILRAGAVPASPYLADFLKSINGGDGRTSTSEEVLGGVREAWVGVDVVLAWTRKHIPYLKRQIAPYQGAALAYFAHLYDRPGARFLEIGTAIGYSACLMATAAPRAMITTLNPKEREFELAVKNLAIRSNVRVVKQTSQEFYDSPSPRPSPSRERGYEGYDLVFVDGDHAYNMVLHDAQFFNHLRVGGLILFHDYSPEGSDRPSDGCYRALNDLAEKHRPFDVLIVGSGQVGMCGWIRQEGEVWN